MTVADKPAPFIFDDLNEWQAIAEAEEKLSLNIGALSSLITFVLSQLGAITLPCDIQSFLESRNHLHLPF